MNIPQSTHWDRERSCPIAGAWTPILLRSMVGRPSRLGPSFCPLSFRVLWMPLLGLVRTVGHPVRTMGHPGSAPRVKSFYPVRTVGHLVRTVGHLGSAPRIKSFCLVCLPTLRALAGRLPRIPPASTSYLLDHIPRNLSLWATTLTAPQPWNQIRGCTPWMQT